MGAIEVNGSSAICSRCGISYGRRKGYFPVSYASNYKGIGYITVCKDCIDKLYAMYLAQCNDARMAVRQVCRKLDLYWSDAVFDAVEKKNTTHTMMTSYIAKTNTNTYVGKSYDDTMLEAGTLWSWKDTNGDVVTPIIRQQNDEEYEPSKEVLEFWGPGFSNSMYKDLEQRRSYWMGRLGLVGDIDAGQEALIRQICNLEIDINRDRVAGKPITTSVNTLNTILGSMNLKPAQQKDESDSANDNTPFGVWIKRFENQRPIPDPDPEMQDVDGIVRYITVWFLGHLCKMLGIRNTYCKLYEDEIARMRIDRPEYEDEDDETMFNDIFGAITE